MAGKLLRWTHHFRAEMRRRAGARPSGAALEREIAAGVLRELRSAAYRRLDGPAGPLQHIGPGIQDLTGYPAAEFRAGRVSLNRLLGAREAAARLRDIETALKERRRFDLQYQLRTADGEDRWLREQGRGLYSDGKLTAVDGLLTDVTESKRPVGEELLGLLVQWISDYAIFTLDPDGAIATWNGGAARILGYAAEDIVGRPFTTFYAEPDADAKLALRRAAAQGSETSRGWLRRKSGAPFWSTVVITPIYEGAKGLTGFAMIVRDFGGGIGREAQTRLHQLADEVPAFVWVAGADGKISYVNARWTEYTGQSRSEALGEGWADTVHPEDVRKVSEFWMGMAANKKLRETELRIRGADGSYRWFLSRGSPINDAHGHVAAVFVTSVDIDEKVSLWRSQKERADLLERAVQERTRQLKESVEELESFSYTASHDLRAPLRSIAGHAQLLLRDFGEKLTAGGREHLQRLSAAAERLDRLLHDLVVYSSLSRTKQHERAEIVDLDRFVSESASRLLPNVEKSLRSPLGRVRCQRSLLSHAIGNVLDNARKFMKKGEKGAVTIWTEASGDRLRLYIEDNGIGIERAQLDKAFRPFQRVHGQDYGGTGIGLSIVKRAVEQMGGTVSLESELGRGSRVCLELPRA